MSRPALTVLASLCLFAAPLFAIGCAAAEEPASSPTDEGSADDEIRRALVLTEADNGKTVKATKGQNVTVMLPSNGSTGYKWVVVATDRTFGYPETEFIPASEATGAGGVDKFTWQTKSSMDMLGSHTVKLEYKRPWEENGTATKTFSFTLDVAMPPFR